LSEVIDESVPAPIVERTLPGWVYVLVGVIGVFALVSLLPFVLLFGALWLERVDKRPFERAKWFDPEWKQTSASHTVRQEMVDDLLEKKLKLGMPMNEVHWLIGPPDVDPYFKPGDWTYFLGRERGMFAIDNEWLSIEFDELGCVSQVRLATD
jgi:hypothetical protein